MADKRPIIGPSQFSELTNSDGLVAGQSAVLSEQSSSPATPASGYGIVYAKTDGKLYFKNDAGTETDLTAGGGTNPVIREYTSNDTWTKPTASNFYGALVVCVGAGGGGASGRRGASASTRGGGSGGGGGAYVFRFLRNADLTLASFAITIGSGGTGSAARTTNDTNGAAGAVGGDTSFGVLVVAKGGAGGSAGTTGAGSGFAIGGNASLCNPARLPYAMCGGNSTAGSTSGTPSTPSTGFNSTDALGTSIGCPGGAGAGGLNSANTERNGGTGASVYDAGVLRGGVAGGDILGTRDGTNGTDNVVNNFLLDINNTLTNAPGLSGGGGASGDNAATAAGGNGGKGGKGAGGGGGGGSTNGANSGAGGNGGDGLCYVVEYYGA